MKTSKSDMMYAGGFLVGGLLGIFMTVAEGHVVAASMTIGVVIFDIAQSLFWDDIKKKIKDGIAHVVR